MVTTLRTPLARKRQPSDAPDVPPPIAGPAKKLARFELRAEQDWLDRIERQAARFGLTAAAYIRQAATVALERDEATER